MYFLLCVLISSTFFHPNDKTIQNVLQISNKRPVFVLYKPKNYANSKIHKIWEKLISKYENDKKVVLADFLCSKYSDFCKSQNALVLPIVFAYFGPNKLIIYQGNITFSSLDRWIKDMISPPVINITNEEKIKNYISNSKVTFVSSHESDYKEYCNIAYFRNNSNTFLFINNNTYPYRLSAYVNENLALHQNDSIESDWTTFIWKNQFPLPFQLTYSNYIPALKSRKYLVIFAYDKKYKISEKFIQSYSLFGEQFYTEMLFSYTKINKMPLLFSKYGVKETSFLVLQNQSYWITSNSPFENMKIFVKQITNEELEPNTLTVAISLKHSLFTVLRQYPALILIILMLLLAIGYTIYLIKVHMKNYSRYFGYKTKTRHQKFH